MSCCFIYMPFDIAICLHRLLKMSSRSKFAITHSSVVFVCCHYDKKRLVFQGETLHFTMSNFLLSFKEIMSSYLSRIPSTHVTLGEASSISLRLNS